MRHGIVVKELVDTRTNDGAVNDGAVLQLNGDRLIGQLHQEPTITFHAATMSSTARRQKPMQREQEVATGHHNNGEPLPCPAGA
jgi:hypothetical protein